MSRAYLVYILMFAALVGGILMIWSLGDNIRAPDDLAGDWVVEWDNAPPPESGEPKLRIAQSGRFFVVKFGQAEPLSMKLRSDWSGKYRGQTLNMNLADGRWELRLRGAIPSGASERWRVPELNLELVGPTRHVGIARRMFPTVSTSEPDGDDAPAAPVAPTPAEAGEPAKPAVELSVTTTNPIAPTAAVPSEPDHAR